jgi:DNA-binding response OmpR family regulator
MVLEPPGNGEAAAAPIVVAVVEDEHGLRAAVSEYLSDHGFLVLAAADGAELRLHAERHRIDVFVLDISMPQEDGLSLARWIRSRSTAGVVFATAAGRPLDRSVGIELGADDYIVKPYALRELLARVRSVLRRLPCESRTAAAPQLTETSSRILGFGGMTANLDARILTGADGRQIDLTTREFDLLEVLAKRPGRVLSRTQLDEMAGGSRYGAGRGLDILIARLRQKIEPDPDRPVFIMTVRGEGYVFSPGASAG